MDLPGAIECAQCVRADFESLVSDPQNLPIICKRTSVAGTVAVFRVFYDFD